MVLEHYPAPAGNALRAGFDGVQIHAANGYLVDRFVRDNATLHIDAYGGSLGDCVRLLREVTQAVVEVFGAEQTAVRLSPNEERQGVNDSDPGPLFEAATAALSEFGISFLEVREPDVDGTNGKVERPPIAPRMRAAFKGPFALNPDYDGAIAQAALDSGKADAIAFGRLFISNPDLPRRLSENLPLARVFSEKGQSIVNAEEFRV